MTIYDIAVIGKGLMGSAALRHLTVNCPGTESVRHRTGRTARPQNT